MADDLHKRRPQDSNKINVHEEWELHYWSQELGVTPQQLKDAVAVAGTSVTAVKKHLGK
jgi:Protein of unknown function (DUF3606)